MSGGRPVVPGASGSRLRRNGMASGCHSGGRLGAFCGRLPLLTAAGLQRSLDLVRAEGTVLELSWYGDREVMLSLGGAFHSGRLALRASQVGAVAPARRGSRTTRERLAFALELLRDPAFDALLTGSSRFDELPDVLARLADGRLPALCHTVAYDEG